MMNVRKGFTIVSLLIAIIVIGILAAMMMMSSSEAVSTARAAAIIANLNTLKKAAVQWYIDNRDKVQPNGQVKINGTSKPIQEWTDEEINLSSYLSHTGASTIHFAKKSSGTDSTGRINTTLQEGNYGICDGGTLKEENGVNSNGSTIWKDVEYHRNAWYVGYCFTKGEDKVKEKIQGRMITSGVFLGTADAHQNIAHDKNVAVWMPVF